MYIVTNLYLSGLDLVSDCASQEVYLQTRKIGQRTYVCMHMHVYKRGVTADVYSFEDRVGDAVELCTSH